MTPKWKITWKGNISCAHKLCLPYKSKCNQLHGHNYTILVTIISNTLNKEKMIIDYSHIKKIVMQYDHKNLNDFFNPTTTEYFTNILAKAIKEKLVVDAKVIVKVKESDKTSAEVEL